jgi:uncharacterized membrane protein YqjE
MFTAYVMDYKVKTRMRGRKEMSEKLKQIRLEKAKHDIGKALLYSMVIVALAVFLYVFLTFIPHIGISNDIFTMPRWQYARDTAIYLLLGVAFTVFLGLFSYWFYQDQKMLQKEKEEFIRETIKKVLKEEKTNE